MPKPTSDKSSSAKAPSKKASSRKTASGKESSKKPVSLTDRRDPDVMKILFMEGVSFAKAAKRSPFKN